MTVVFECFLIPLSISFPNFINSLHEKMDTFIGDRGIKISGGEKQRIGIARALYKGAKVLVFDEATNALDSKTEKNVINSIEGLGKDTTVLMIAHRLTTLINCNKIIFHEDSFN